MSVFDRLYEVLGVAHVANPGIFRVRAQVIRHASAEWDRFSRLNGFPASFKNEQFKLLGAQCQEIETAADPVMACRERLCDAVAGMARFQVLVIPPAPEHDQTGLRGQPGVTGELKAHAKRALEAQTDLRAQFQLDERDIDDDDFWGMVLLAYETSAWFAGALNEFRMSLGDYVSDTTADWFRPLLHANAVCWESLYREDLDLPSAFSVERSLAPLMYSKFVDAVLGGHERPDEAWREGFYEQIVAGELPLPDFVQPPSRRWDAATWFADIAVGASFSDDGDP